MATKKTEKKLRQDLVQNAEKYAKIISLYKGRPCNKTIVCAPAVLEAGKTESGLIIPDAAMTHAFDNSGQHGHQQQKNQYDTQVMVVIASSPRCEEKVEPGDVIRYNPMYSGKFTWNQYELVHMNDIDLRIVEGNIFE